jgi:histidine decarboxylase
MDQKRKTKVLSRAKSPYLKYSDGYGNPDSKTGNYILGVVLEVGISPIFLSHEGSSMLDEINAFDMAERNSTYIGQVNMSIVSSFCGPQGVIIGHDFAREKVSNTKIPGLEIVEYRGVEIPVYSIKPLQEATQSLFGTVEDKRMHLKPGAHVPFASKNIKKKGPARLYSCLAIGIAKDRTKNACLLMEDVGEIPLDIEGTDLKSYYLKVLRKAAQSVLVIGDNQKVEYEKILVGLEVCFVQEGQIGCALVAAPYFTMPRKIHEKTSATTLLKMNLKDFDKHVVKKLS